MTPHRLHAIKLLLGSILDLRFEPETWSGQLVRKNAVRGESPSKRIKCPNCDGEGTIRRRGMRFPCERCGGVFVTQPMHDPDNGRHCPQMPSAEEVKVCKPGRGWIEVDDYTERQVGSVRTEVIVQTRTVHCDAGCDKGSIGGGPWRGENNRCLRCGGSGRIELTQSQWRATRSGTATTDSDRRGSGDARLDCMERREAAGSYAELDIALAELHNAWPALYRLVLEVYVGKEQVDERLERVAGWGLEFIEARMPLEIRVPAGVREAERRKEEAAA